MDGGGEEPLSYDELLAGKFKEMKDIQDLKLKSLERRLSDKEEDLLLLEARHEELEKDFQFNLRVIEERDRVRNNYFIYSSYIYKNLKDIE